MGSRRFLGLRKPEVDAAITFTHYVCVSFICSEVLQTDVVTWIIVSTIEVETAVFIHVDMILHILSTLSFSWMFDGFKHLVYAHVSPKSLPHGPSY